MDFTTILDYIIEIIQTNYALIFICLSILLGACTIGLMLSICYFIFHIKIINKLFKRKILSTNTYENNRNSGSY